MCDFSKEKRKQQQAVSIVCIDRLLHTDEHCRACIATNEMRASVNKNEEYDSLKKFFLTLSKCPENCRHSARWKRRATQNVFGSTIEES